MKNLVGSFSDAASALNMVASGGTPVTGLVAGGSLVTARLEHFWVEAFVDYVPSRGVARGEGDTWVPLDASFKRFTYSDGIDLAAASGFDSEAFFKSLVAEADTGDPNGAVSSVNLAAMETESENVRENIRAYLLSQSVGPTLRDIVGGKKIEEVSTTVLPASLPYKVIVRGAKFANVPSSLRHKLRFEVASSSGLTPDMVYEATLPELAGQKITIGYSAATPADEATLKSFLPSAPNPAPGDFPTTIPAYLVKVKPELRINGKVVATGGNSTLGQKGRFILVFTRPGASLDRVENDIIAGSYSAVVLNLGTVEDGAARQAQAQANLTQVRAGNVNGLTKDDVIGEFLHGAGLLYWSELELFASIASQVKRVVTTRLPSEGIFSYDLKVALLFGTPRSVSSGAVSTDVDTDIQAVLARDGDRQRILDYMAVTGIHASRTEPAIYDQIVNATPTGAGISAASYIEEAVRQHIPIFHINKDNVDSVLPRLSVAAAIKTDIRNSVAAGRVVTIPQTEFLKDGFQGIGYIVFNLETGAAGYLISGGLAGGGFQLPPLNPLAVFLLGLSIAFVSFFEIKGGPVVLAIFSIVLTAYDFASTVLDIKRKNPNLEPDQLNMVIFALGIFALIGTILAIVGIYAEDPRIKFVAYALYFSFLAIMESISIQAILDIFRNRPVPLLTRQRPLEEERERKMLGLREIVAWA